MYINLRKVLIILPFVAFIMAISLNSAWANGAPISFYKRFTGSLGPTIPTTIVIEEENLKFDFQIKERWVTNVLVNVNYLLYNNGGKAEEVTVGFPVPSTTTKADIFLDDKTLNYSTTYIDLNKETLPTWLDGEFSWIDPLKEEEYKIVGMKDLEKIKLLLFKVKLNPKEKNNLVVQYLHRPSWDRSKYINEIYHLNYLLEPASYWEDFNNLKVTVNLPEHWLLQSKPELIRKSNTVYEGFFEKLPGEALNISVITKKGFWLGQGSYYVIWLVITSLFVVVGFLWGLFNNEKWVTLVGWLIYLLLIAKGIITFKDVYINKFILSIVLLCLSMFLSRMAYFLGVKIKNN